MPLGRVVATERRPNTPHEFHFWTAIDSPVGIGTIVRVDILNGRFEEARALLTVTPEAEAEVKALDAAITQAMGAAGIDTNRHELRLAALARALAREATAVEKDLAQ